MRKVLSNQGGSMKKHCAICKIIALLAGIGAVNWGLVAFFQLDLVARLLGTMTMPSKIVYGVVGLSGLSLLVTTFIKSCPCCDKSGCGTASSKTP